MGFLRQEFGAGCHFLFQVIVLTQGLNPHLLHWQVDSLPLIHQGNPADYILVTIILGNHPILPTHAKKQLTHIEKQLFHFYRDCRKSETRQKRANFVISTRLLEMCSLYILKFTPEYRRNWKEEKGISFFLWSIWGLSSPTFPKKKEKNLLWVYLNILNYIFKNPIAKYNPILS